MSRRIPFCLLALLIGAMAFNLTAADDSPPAAPPPSPEDAAREAAIADFTAKQEALNWPEKFERIGDEMGVPPDVLAAVAFCETRWEQLTWPPGETVSPENGMPRPYGVMSLWDNDFFGHTLNEAANLIGSTPDALKTDPELNIRGAAALLRKYYDDNSLPDGTAKADIESWQTAIEKYCGIPDPYLAYHHVVSCYAAMNRGYDEYGMHWKPHPVNLKPMRDKLAKLQAAYDAKMGARQTTPPDELSGPPPIPVPPEKPAAKPQPILATPAAPAPPVAAVSHTAGWWPAIGVFVIVLVIIIWRLVRKGVEQED